MLNLDVTGSAGLIRNNHKYVDKNIVKHNLLCWTIFYLHICDSVQHNGDVSPENDTEQNSTHLTEVSVRSHVLNFVLVV
jgi:hypothetical protein